MVNELKESVKILKDYFSKEEEMLVAKGDQIKTCLDLLNHLEEKILEEEKRSNTPEPANYWHINFLEVIRQFM